MHFIKNYSDLKHERLRNARQHWYYVIVMNPMDPSPAAQTMLQNLNLFHLDSGEDCTYFIPGFYNTDWGILQGFHDLLDKTNTIKIKGMGKVHFSPRDFIGSIHQLERDNHINWHFRNDCELLLFRIDYNGRIVLGDFFAYNLDDILRSGGQITPFMRETIHVGVAAQDAFDAKNRLDTIYESLITPWSAETGIISPDVVKIWDECGFANEQYYFISYSSRDQAFVTRVRERIETSGIRCWMAPRDIPSGANYAQIIELAIKNAAKFLLFLSPHSVWSVWVEKELQRAIHHFQHENASKILPVWLDHEFLLDETPMALPMEGIQIIGTLKAVNDCTILLPDESRERLKTKDKLAATISHYEHNMVTPDSLQTEFTKLLGIASSVRKNVSIRKYPEIASDLETLNLLCRTLTECLREFSQHQEVNQEFCQIFEKTWKLSTEIRDHMNTIFELL